MIDINELRRLAQAATPGPWKTGQYLGSLRQFVIYTDVGDKGRGSDVAFTSAAFGSDDTVANARLIAAANPATITELLDRLESTESDCLEQARLNGMGSEREAALLAKLEAAERDTALKERIIDSLGAELNAVAKERDALRTELADLRSSMTFRTSLIGRIEAERDALQAKVEAMERQEPVAVVDYKRGSCVRFVEYLGWQKIKDEAKLYALPGAQPAPKVPEVTLEMENAFYEKVTVTRVGSIVGLAEGIKAAMIAAHSKPEAKP